MQNVKRLSGFGERINLLTSKGQLSSLEALFLWGLADQDEVSVRSLVAELEQSGKKLLSYVNTPTQEVHPAITQGGDNWTDDQESEAPPAMGTQPGEGEQGFEKERDKLFPSQKTQPLSDPGEASPGHSEIQDRYRQAPEDGR